MSTRHTLLLCAAIQLPLTLDPPPVSAQDLPTAVSVSSEAPAVSLTAAPTETFSYQGALEDAGLPANGMYDFAVTVWDQSSSGSKIATCTNLLDAPVEDGIFSLLLQPDVALSQVFDGSPRWIQVEVRKTGTGTWTTLPRSPISGTPYAWGLRPGTRLIGAYDGSMLRIENTSTSSAAALTATSATPTGVTIGGHHAGDGYGLFGSTAGAYPAVGGMHTGNGIAVAGYAQGTGTGVHGSASSTLGIGVAGFQTGYSKSDAGGIWTPGGYFGGRNGVIAISKEPGGYALYAENKATSTASIGVFGVTGSADGYAGYFNGGTAVYAKAVSGTRSDLVLAGNSTSDDNGWLTSDPIYPSSDLSITSYDDINLQLDRNGDEAGVFWISDQGGINVFSVDEAGIVRANGTIVHSSDRDRKEGFESIDPADLLRGVASLPITKWRFTGTASAHIGPTAQDFRAAFGLGDSDTGIATVDADGVALAAIQALAETNRRLQAELDEQGRRLAELEKLVLSLAR